MRFWQIREGFFVRFENRFPIKILGFGNKISPIFIDVIETSCNRRLRALITPKDRVRARLLQVAFGLTLKEWNAIFVYQHGRCFICGKSSKRRLHTDHDHKSGLCRGLLCSSCNRALGKAQDPRWCWTAICFYRAYIYLLSPPAVAALGKKVYGFPGKIGTKKYQKWVRNRERKHGRRTPKS